MKYPLDSLILFRQLALKYIEVRQRKKRAAEEAKKSETDDLVVDALERETSDTESPLEIIEEEEENERKRGEALSTWGGKQHTDRALSSIHSLPYLVYRRRLRSCSRCYHSTVTVKI